MAKTKEEKRERRKVRKARRKKIRRVILRILLGIMIFMLGVFVGVHRRVIIAMITKKDLKKLKNLKADHCDFLNIVK